MTLNELNMVVYEFASLSLTNFTSNPSVFIQLMNDEAEFTRPLIVFHPIIDYACKVIVYYCSYSIYIMCIHVYLNLICLCVQIYKKMR